jgi:hypothetical protein
VRVAGRRDLGGRHGKRAWQGKFGIGFEVSFDRDASPTKLKVTCRIAKTTSDEMESVIEYPRQQKFL